MKIHLAGNIYPVFENGKGRDDLTYPTSNKQLNFLQHIYRSLNKNGKARAAVVLPDNVLLPMATVPRYGQTLWTNATCMLSYDDLQVANPF